MIFAALVVAGCATSSSPPATASLPESDGLAVESVQLQAAPPSAEARMIFDQIQDYQFWPTFPELPIPGFSTAHGGRYVIAFHNAVVTAAMRDQLLPLPDGAQIVMENRRSPNTNEPSLLTIMAKERGRWFWLETSDSSVVLDAQGRPIAGFGTGGTAVCVACHSDAAANDYVFLHDFHPKREP